VFSPGPNTFLRAGGTGERGFLFASEIILELHHPGVGEEEGRVFLRN
jgi:hypothetical protein